MVRTNFLGKLAFYASFFAFIVIGLGAFTRLIDAGLGCPDWPGCYGHLYPQTPLAAYKAWAEMVHRYAVAILSLFILGIISLTFIKKSLRKFSNIFLALILILLLAYQIMLGQWTVTFKLLPLIVSQHLLGGFFILATLWLIHLNNKSFRHCEEGTDEAIQRDAAIGLLRPQKTRARNDNNGVRFNNLIFLGALIALVLLVLQITLGAWTSTNYASVSCTDFPFCINDQVMNWQFKAAFNFFSPVGINYEGGTLSTPVRQTIQMAHRLGALILVSYLIIFIALTFSVLQRSPALMRLIYLQIGLVFVQIALGISNVIFKLPLITAIMHNLVAALLLLTLITLVFKLRYESNSQ